MIEYRVYRDDVLVLTTTDEMYAIYSLRDLKERFADTAAGAIVALTEEEAALEKAGYPGRPFAVPAAEQAAHVLELERLGLVS